MNMKQKDELLFFGLSDIGKQRTNNEDAFVAEKLDEKTVLAVAIDGVGGYEGGEVAAKIAQDEIPRYMHDFRNGERLELLKRAVVYANNSIYDRRMVDIVRSSMSCVLTAAVIDSQRKVIDMVHVGDTRMYQYYNGALIKLSHDHSLIGYREEMGDLTEEQAMHHPQRNVISRDVGSAKHEVEDRDFLESTEVPLQPNSILLLCSDGLTDLITSKQIVSVLSQGVSLEEKTQSLIDAANDAGGKDNVTVVLVEYKSDEYEDGKKQTASQIKSQPQAEKRTLVEEVVTENMNDEQSGISTNDMKKSNLWVIIAIILIALLGCVSLWYTVQLDRELRRLRSDFENYLLEFQKVTQDSSIEENDSIMQPKDAEMTNVNNQLNSKR